MGREREVVRRARARGRRARLALKVREFLLRPFRARVRRAPRLLRRGLGGLQLLPEPRPLLV